MTVKRMAHIEGDALARKNYTETVDLSQMETGLTPKTDNGTSGLETKTNVEIYREWLRGPLNAPIPSEITWRGWCVWGKELTRHQEKMWWKIAFWLLHGERKWGETYVQIAEDLGVSKNTLYQATTIARAFEFLELTLEITPKFWNCHPLTHKLLTGEERLQLAAEAVNQKFSQKKIEAFVREFLKTKSIAEETPPPPPAFNGGLAKDAPDDGLPIAPNGKAERERAKQAGEAIAARLNLPEATQPQAEAEQESDPFDELKTLRLDAAMYQKVKPYLERIEKCIEEDILDWLSDTAATLEEEKAWAQQNG